ncbi:sigma-70 family RNA polymerase sigma factor [Actinacidiphila sp. DG2A-62]|uniref:sigma-70 family RNA polymerase sigma factor n=1 Tax=Actinacidiphila sp. DG2A-62 TaxID=3108821 RepID=UPI002DBFF4D8|nr:sigma-70 family RNA polymerase sigma factor [Actinacidiphila sp. DG2A-62]MEC3996025.1 sigma-70 family RNA polymerase sigma factor [Actinacidiphila sp. DG2A-62]
MDRQAWLLERFEEHRPRLRAVAYRMLGSLAETDDAVQDAWVRVSRADAEAVRDPAAWLTTVVGRVCLTMLRTRERRREEPLDAYAYAGAPGDAYADGAAAVPWTAHRMPDPLIGDPGAHDPEQQVLIADAVGLALMVVMDAMAPAERLAFVLHDMFAVPFEEIAPLVEKTPAATRQLASRARRRVRDGAPEPDADPARQRAAVDAFFAAAHEGDLDALVALLAPDIVLRSDGGAKRPQLSVVLRGAHEVAGQAVRWARLSQYVHPVLINGVAGAVVAPHGRVVTVMAFTVVDGRVVAIDSLSDQQRLDGLGLAY